MFESVVYFPSPFLFECPMATLLLWKVLRHMPFLRELDLYQCWVADEGLVSLPFDCPHLQRLDLRSTLVSNKSLSLLSHLPNLQVLDLRDSAHIEVEACAALLEHVLSGATCGAIHMPEAKLFLRTFVES
eukprot:m.477133 g.477133  ORF g.477133 m.477133 type:complete len:130 (+) comp57155_c2_seq16:2245-2634(+)